MPLQTVPVAAKVAVTPGPHGVAQPSGLAWADDAQAPLGAIRPGRCRLVSCPPFERLLGPHCGENLGLWLPALPRPPHRGGCELGLARSGVKDRPWEPRPGKRVTIRLRF